VQVGVDVDDCLEGEDAKQEDRVGDGQEAKNVEHRGVGEGSPEDDDREDVSGEAEETEDAGDSDTEHFTEHDNVGTLVCLCHDSVCIIRHIGCSDGHCRLLKRCPVSIVDKPNT